MVEDDRGIHCSLLRVTSLSVTWQCANSGAGMPAQHQEFSEQPLMGQVSGGHLQIGHSPLR